MSRIGCQSYIYHPLQYVDSIRLLELVPGPKGSPLSCYIKEVRKGNMPKYEALSYAWGDPIFSQTIEEVSSGAHLNITVNLYNALQGIRQEDVPRSLWADSICINQLDLREKGHQVASMGPIFENAWRVVVWLGCQKGAPGRINCVLQDIVHVHEAYTKDRFLPSASVVRVVHKLYAMRLFEQPWYNRVWVVQEFVLARELQFATTHDIVGTELLLTAVDALLDVDKYMHTHGYYPEFKVHLQSLCMTARLMSQMFYFRRKRLSVQDQPPTLKRATSGISLTSCLVDLSRGRECRDSRDRLYAMLALAEDNLSITPDYSSTLPDLLNPFASQSLLKNGLALLHASGIRPDHEAGLVSFAPSISSWENMTMSLDAPQLRFSTSTDSAVAVTIEAASAASIRGTKIDTLDSTTDFPRRYISREELHQQISYVASWTDLPVLPYRFNDIKGVYTYAHAQFPYTKYSIKDLFAAIVTLETGHFSDLFDPYHHPVEDLARPFLKHRSLFKTTQGYLGMGPSWMQPNDQVVIFDGGVTPFILRKVVSKDGKASDKWQLVGDCFLFGWMHGDYFGHTVVDEIPVKADGEEQDGTDGAKYLVRESFTLI